MTYSKKDIPLFHLSFYSWVRWSWGLELYFWRLNPPYEQGCYVYRFRVEWFPRLPKWVHIDYYRSDLNPQQIIRIVDVKETLKGLIQ